jgi:hypothetical protein
VANIRLPLINTAEFRSSDTSKDSVIVNGFAEAESESISYVYKRAGRISKINGAGTANGIFVYGLNVYCWDSGHTATTPNVVLLSSL